MKEEILTTSDLRVVISYIKLNNTRKTNAAFSKNFSINLINIAKDYVRYR